MINNHHTTQFPLPDRHRNTRRPVGSVSFAATLILLIGGFVSISVVAGCGGSSRGPVSGTVTLDERPLEYGVISFRPVKGNAAPGSGGVVTNGNFEIPAGKGLQPGDYKVNIEVLKKTGQMVRDFPGGLERPERIPVQINETGQLKATVGVGEEDRLEFSLTTKANRTRGD